MDALLAAPDRNTVLGRRDYTLLLFLYNSGARASETALRVENLIFRPNSMSHAKYVAKATRRADVPCGRPQPGSCLH